MKRRTRALHTLWGENEIEEKPCGQIECGRIYDKIRTYGKLEDYTVLQIAYFIFFLLFLVG
jgi:hypothetical protein